MSYLRGVPSFCVWAVIWIRKSFLSFSNDRFGVNGFCYLDRTGVSVYDNAANHVFYNEQPSGNSQRVAKGKAILQTLYDKVGAINSGKYK